jgi:hypothetical protein
MICDLNWLLLWCILIPSSFLRRWRTNIDSVTLYTEIVICSFLTGRYSKVFKCLTVVCARASIQILMAKELWFCSIEILIIDFWVLQIVFFFPWVIFYSVGSDLHFYCSFIFFSLIQYFLIRSTVIIGDILLPHSYQRSRSLPIVHRCIWQ